MNIFYDAEFTGLHQQTTLISLALVDEADREFYAEFTDYDLRQCDAWIRQNVLAHTRWLSRDKPPLEPIIDDDGALRQICGNRAFVTSQLREWLKPYEQVTIWADCYAWDWVLFCELFGGAMNIPQNIFYMPADLATLFHCLGLDPDTDREAYAGLDNNLTPRHNALKDALVTRACHQRLIKQHVRETAEFSES